MRVTIGLIAAVLLTGTALAAPAPQDDDIVQYIINNPPVTSWQINGVETQPRPRRAEGVLGERAVSVRASRAEQPWTTAGQMTIRGAIKQGDTILLAVWARLATPAPGQTTSPLPIRVQQATAPYTAIAEATGQIGPSWKMVYASGVARQDYAEGTTNLAVHLATADHTVELGPALVLDFGQNYDAAKLPINED
ncbi:hypothetical protein BZG35_07270 [Brevundimonas sp. LM2]|uniref:hypothetical protein n=1 Tax=Brevundimonas sp. LM2 TaxID=1938605 RepID=UPI000983F3B6|nr:hypothetical protein [Brevundimonas sp. LM2]AQR61473.1 hypothetical protein BZG35_07270 [Brevundimonas sp. LM2]